MEDVALLQHDQHAAGKAHRQGTGGEVGHAPAEEDAEAVEPNPAHEAHDDAHAQEEGGELIEVPAPLEHAHDEQGEGGAHDQQHHLAGAGQLGQLIQIHLLLPLAVELVHQAAGGVGLDAPGVEVHIHRRDGEHHHQDDEAVPHAGVEGQAGDALGHAHVGRLDKGARVAAGAAHNRHRQTGDGVVAHGNTDGHQEGDEHKALLKHAEGAGAEAHHKDHDGDEQPLPFGGLFDDTADACLNGLGLCHHAKGAADDEDESRDVGRLDDTLLYGHERLHGGHRSLLHPVIAAVHKDLHAVVIYVGVVLTCRNDIGQDRTHGDDEQDQCEHVGEGDAPFLFFCHLLPSPNFR